MVENYTFFKSYYDAICDLDDDIRLKCYDIICKYALFNEVPDVTGIPKTVFTLVKPNIDASVKRRKDGKKGGRPPKNKKDGSENEKRVVSENEKGGFEECKTNKDKDKERDKDKDKEYEKDMDKEMDISPLIPPKEKTQKRETQQQIFTRLIEDRNIGLEMEKVLREWLKYKSERKETYQETGMSNMISQVQNAAHRYGEIAVMERIRRAMGDGWKGMNLDKMVEQKSPERRMDNVNSMLDRWEVASEEYERRRNDTG